jgi:hypothetical protein
MRHIAAMLALVLASAGAPQSRPDAAMPTRFHMALNGMLGAGKGVVLEKDVLVYTVYGMQGAKQQRREIRPTPEQWRRFREALDAINVWRWRADYPNPGVADGLGWEIEAAYADRKVFAAGTNNFPDDTGRPTGSPKASSAFERLSAAVGELVGDSSF